MAINRGCRSRLLDSQVMVVAASGSREANFMVAPHATILESLDDRGIGVRIEFRWRGDRFAHTIYFVHDEDRSPLFASIEGMADEAWPPSPTYQELSEVESDGRRSLLLTGMSGSTHWSASVESEDHHLQFDLAARLKTMPARFGATYELCGGVEWHSSAGFLLSNYRVGERNPTVGLTGGPNVMVNGPSNNTKNLELLPQQPPPSYLPLTVRWQYRVGSTTN